MEERERRINGLIEVVGCDREEAELRLLDDDLWLLDPEMRIGRESTVEEREYALGFAMGLEEGFANGWCFNEATRQLIWDLRRRAEEALRRARERAGE